MKKTLKTGKKETKKRLALTDEFKSGPKTHNPNSVQKTVLPSLIFFFWKKTKKKKITLPILPTPLPLSLRYVYSVFLSSILSNVDVLFYKKPRSFFTKLLIFLPCFLFLFFFFFCRMDFSVQEGFSAQLCREKSAR